MYAEYKNYLSNALETMKQDHYPKTLTDAINSASRFHRGTKSDHTPVSILCLVVRRLPCLVACIPLL